MPPLHNPIPQPEIPFSVGPFTVTNRFGDTAEIGLVCDHYDLYDLPSPDGLGTDTIAAARWVSGSVYLEPEHRAVIATMAWAWNGRTPIPIINAAVASVGRAIAHYYAGVLTIPGDPLSVERPLLWPLHQRLMDAVIAGFATTERLRGACRCLAPVPRGDVAAFRDYVPSYYRLPDEPVGPVP